MSTPARQTAVKWTPLLLSALRIAAGLLFFQHGAEKMWGFANGRIDHGFATLHGFAGPLEVVGGGLLILGLFTRTTAFVLCGEMAVAYFSRWAPRGLWPINNGGEESVIFCFLFLWLVTAGAGQASVDCWIQSRHKDARLDASAHSERLSARNAG
jgi:putative oxidoreductase